MRTAYGIACVALLVLACAPSGLALLDRAPPQCRRCAAVVEASGLLEMSKERAKDRSKLHAQCLDEDPTNPTFSECLSTRVAVSLRSAHRALCTRDDFVKAHGPDIVAVCEEVVSKHLDKLTTEWKKQVVSLDAELLFDAQAEVCSEVSDECKKWCVARVAAAGASHGSRVDPALVVLQRCHRFDKVKEEDPPKAHDECATCLALAGHVWGVADRARRMPHFGTSKHAWALMDAVCGSMSSRMPLKWAQRLGNTCEWLEDEDEAVASALQDVGMLGSMQLFQQHVCNTIGDFGCDVPEAEIAVYEFSGQHGEL